MLKKTALSLFGLVVMLVCFNPPQAHAGVVVSFGPVFPRPVYVRPYAYAAPVPYVAYQPDPYFYAPNLCSDVCSSGLGLSSGLLWTPVYCSAVRASRVRGTPSVLAAVRSFD